MFPDICTENLFYYRSLLHYMDMDGCGSGGRCFNPRLLCMPKHPWARHWISQNTPGGCVSSVWIVVMLIIRVLHIGAVCECVNGWVWRVLYFEWFIRGEKLCINTVIFSSLHFQVSLIHPSALPEGIPPTHRASGPVCHAQNTSTEGEWCISTRRLNPFPCEQAAAASPS